MTRFHVIIADPPYGFSDKLSMSSTKRGANANYNTLTIEDLKLLKVPEITENNALLALWVPSSLLQSGLDIMKAWGFRQTQTVVWVKIKKEPFSDLWKQLKKNLKFDNKKSYKPRDFYKEIVLAGSKIIFNDILSFYMGRLFRQTHELCLIGVKGKIYSELKNHSQRSVHLAPNLKHSAKPEDLQDSLEKMFPGSHIKFLELFARRSRPGWTCLGNESPDCPSGEDIRDSITRIAAL